jgi:hypothetical protein
MLVNKITPQKWRIKREVMPRKSFESTEAF